MRSAAVPRPALVAVRHHSIERDEANVGGVTVLTDGAPRVDDAVTHVKVEMTGRRSEIEQGPETLVDLRLELVEVERRNRAFPEQLAPQGLCPRGELRLPLRLVGVIVGYASIVSIGQARQVTQKPGVDEKLAVSGVVATRDDRSGRIKER